MFINRSGCLSAGEFDLLHSFTITPSFYVFNKLWCGVVDSIAVYFYKSKRFFDFEVYYSSSIG